MSKYIYLFELDSVRTHDEEIRIGQRALFDEIIHNGHTVVLTFNQLVDSRGFFSLLDDPDYFNNLVALFDNGAIRISQYGNTRTISQYLLTAFEDNKDFIYSGWPLRSSQRRLIALIKRSLTFSDLSELFSYIGDEEAGIERTKTDNEIRDLFIEVDKKGSITESTADPEDLRAILVNLYSLLKIILRLSTMHSIYIPPKEPREYAKLKLKNILHYIVNMDAPTDDPLWEGAISIIRCLKAYKNGVNNRTPYLREIYKKYNKAALQNRSKTEYEYAEAMVNLVYNYACEISICDVSKHYNIDELTDLSVDSSTLRADFLHRLKEYWKIGFHDERFLRPETLNFEEFKEEDKASNASLISLSGKALHITEYSNRNSSISGSKRSSTAKTSEETRITVPKDIHRYEYKLDERHKDHIKSLKKAMGKETVSIVICMIIVCILEVLLDFLYNYVISPYFVSYIIPNNSVVIEKSIFSVISTIVLLIFSEFITDALSRHTPITPLSESLRRALALKRDKRALSEEPKALYTNPDSTDVDKVEPKSKRVPIDIIPSYSLKKYVSAMSRSFSGGKNNISFAPAEEYPIADYSSIGKRAYLKDLTRWEELHNKRLGIIYESKYNTLVVDLVEEQTKEQSKSAPKSFTTYERIIPSGGNGVVMVTRCNGNFVLLRQFRHAPRKEQLCFPRGHGELRLSTLDNIREELKDEIQAVISKDPILLGFVSPDSGLTSSRTSVYLVEIDSYSEKVRVEGIREIFEVSYEEFVKMIQSNKEPDTAFDDGYTLAAFALYDNYMRQNAAMTV